MARFKKTVNEESIPKEAFEPTDFSKRTLEIRGHDDRWKVYYPDEASIASPVPYYDKEGKLKQVLYVGVPTTKMIEAHEPFSSKEEAIEYAEYLSPGCEVKIVEATDRTIALEKAREAKRQKALEAQIDETEDD